MDKPTNFLTEDSIKPSLQNFVCISFLTNNDMNIKTIDEENNKSTDNCNTTRKLLGIKIRGVFDKYDEACEYAKKLQTIDPHFNIYVGEIGKWLPFDIDNENIQNSEYQNNELNDMMKSYHENQEKANLLHEKRKNEMVLNTIKDNIKNRKTNLEELQEELNSKINNNNMTLNTKITCAEEQIIELNNNEKEIEDKINDLTKKINNFYNNENK